MDRPPTTGQLSPDKQWRWDGQRWVPVTPPRRRGCLIGGLVSLALVIVLVVVGAVAASRATPQTRSTAGTSTASCSPQPCANDGNGWVVAVSDVRYDAPAGHQFDKPEAGNVFVTLNVTFQNRTGKEQHANPTEFVLQDASGIKHRLTIMSSTCPVWEAVNLAAGATLGPKCIAFQAAAGKPTGLTLVWTPGLLSGDRPIKLT